MRTKLKLVRDLFERALIEEPADLDPWLEREAPDDPEVRDEVRSLLENEDRAKNFLTRPVPDPDPWEPDAPAYPPGHVLGSYTIVRELGGGGMGRVYLARDARLGRDVALKAIAPRFSGDPAQRERLKREAQAAAALTHPGICTVYALEEFDGELFIAAEYIDGWTLREELAGRPRPQPADILRTARDIAAALSAAHARGIVHRDLKPENVMRTADGRLKIVDFGLAYAYLADDDARAVRVTRTGVLVGTPGYMAPEQLDGARGDARADVFAFGVLIYELACGKHPFEAPSAVGMAARVLQSDVVPLENLCPALPMSVSSVVERCLKKSPAERYASAGDIAAALDVERPIPVPPTPVPPTPAVRWWRAHQCIVIGLYFLACVVAWLIKQGLGPAALGVFGIVTVAATVGGVLRSQLLFVERMNRRALAAERRRTDPITLLIDALIAVVLAVDGVLLSTTNNNVNAALTAGLGIGLILARLRLEPFTTEEAFGKLPHP